MICHGLPPVAGACRSFPEPMEGSGNLGAVSVGISEVVIVVVLVPLVLPFGAWKLVKLIWAALSG